jgi:hypothetical protein
MRSSRRSSWLAVASAIFAAALFALSCVSLNPRGQVLAGAQSTAISKGTALPVVTYTLYAGLWRTDHTFVSTIRIKNSLVVAPLDVQPILFMADGTAYLLPPVHLPVSGVVTLDVNQALSQAPQSLAGHMSSIGSAALIYRYPSAGHVVASMSMIDVPRSLSFACAFGELMNHSASKQALEGLWWKHDAGVSGFLALSNLTDTETTVNLHVVGSRGGAKAKRVVAVGARHTEILDLDDLVNEIPVAERQTGGVSVQYEGEMGGIAVTGGLENGGEGYSANIPFFFRDVNSASATQVNFASAGVLMGKPDPTMMPGFPADTTLTPYLVLRNTSEKRIEPEVQVNYMAGDKPVSRSLGNQVLGPFEAKQVDLPSILDAAGLNGFNGPINLSVSLSEHLGDLVLATGSVDQTGTYVLEVEPQGVGESGRKIGQYWSVANGNNTMFSLWNPTDKAQDILMTIFYGDGSGKYILAEHLNPHGSTMIGMAMLIAEKKPDANGNVIPAGITEGSASFENPEQGHNMTLVIAGGTFNVADATCHPVCINCCAITPAFLPFDPFCPIGAILDCSVQGTDCNGTVSTLRVTSWNSSDTSIATISSSGAMTGVAVGQVTITAGLAPIPNHTGQICLFFPTCNQPAAVSQKMSVTPRIDSINPNLLNAGDAGKSVTIHGAGFGASPTVNLPSGVSANNQQDSTDSTIVLPNVSVAANTSIGSNSITVTANALTSAPSPFTIDGPDHLIVVSDTLGHCSGCTTTVNRIVKYQVIKFGGSPVFVIPIGEAFTKSGWNCSDPEPGFISTPCSSGGDTLTDGTFLDEWTVGSDGHTPVGCGWNALDHWQWCAAPKTIGTLNGYIHTNACSINGVVNPPNQFPQGQPIYP